MIWFRIWWMIWTGILVCPWRVLTIVVVRGLIVILLALIGVCISHDVGAKIETELHRVAIDDLLDAIERSGVAGCTKPPLMSVCGRESDIVFPFVEGNFLYALTAPT